MTTTMRTFAADVFFQASLVADTTESQFRLSLMTALVGDALAKERYYVVDSVDIVSCNGTRVVFAFTGPAAVTLTARLLSMSAEARLITIGVTSLDLPMTPAQPPAAVADPKPDQDGTVRKELALGLAIGGVVLLLAVVGVVVFVHSGSASARRNAISGAWGLLFGQSYASSFSMSTAVSVLQPSTNRPLHDDDAATDVPLVPRH